jgi:hypothetical protein
MMSTINKNEEQDIENGIGQMREHLLHSVTSDTDQFVAFHNNTFNKTVYFFAIVVGIGLFIFLGYLVYNMLHGG